MRTFAVILLLVSAARAGIVADVRAAIKKNDVAGAERLVSTYRKQHGSTPEGIEALSWVARGALAARDYDRAVRLAEETSRLALAELKTREVDAEPHLPLALGASIEVRGQALAARGDRAEAVAFLRRELQAYWKTSLRARIQKNLNLLTLEGKRAPALDVSHWLGRKPPTLAALEGRPVLLFFWAHWCPDCKAEAPLIARIKKEYGPKGLVVIGPTQHYGYVARGEEATPDEELRYIGEVWKKVYSALDGVPAPVSEENFKRYGASTVPTVVVIDRRGIVRLYHPDRIAAEELERAVRGVVGKAP